MKPTIIIFLCGLAAALIAFGISVSRKIQSDPVDPAAAERAVRRSLWRHPRLTRFLRERMDRKSAGGFLLTASLLILFAVAIFTGVILDMIDNHTGFAAADNSVAKWGSLHSTSAAAQAMKWITQLGSTVVIIAALLITACVDYFRRRSREVFVFVAAIGIGELVLNNVLKVIVHRDRPLVVERLVVVHGYSFPSGHTVAAAACWMGIALVLGRDRSRLVRATLAAGAALIAVSVATSRALLGVHWLSDVIAGLIIGWGWFTIVAIIFGGRAQRLGDPVADHPQGVASAEPVPEHATSR
ncbi:MAG: phosphatase PAP2 family protein [Ilumatobacteraceae bacterium]|nr:phosphatase PAP2 family protein [Ilumatobacteraceae bacterium]